MSPAVSGGSFVIKDDETAGVFHLVRHDGLGLHLALGIGIVPEQDVFLPWGTGQLKRHLKVFNRAGVDVDAAEPGFLVMTEVVPRTHQQIGRLCDVAALSAFYWSLG